MTTDPYLSRLAGATLLVPFLGGTPPRWVIDGLGEGIAGVVLFAINGNVPDTEALAALTAELRRAGNPIVAIDEEGGDVTRLAHATGSPYPGNAALGVVDDTGLTRRVYRSIGAELRAAGVNLDFAPAADVNTADDNPVIGTRAFGSDPALVSRHTSAAVTGLQEAGVAACAKHFPGHGATAQDSHLEIPTIEADMDLLDRRELAPFRAAIGAGVQAVMTGHLRVPALTAAAPATLSYATITGLLHGRLGFSGPVVSDAMDMHAASGALGIPEASVRALAAGVDLLCLGAKEFEDSVRAVREAIVAAVRDGRLSGDRLAAAAGRTERLKSWLAGRTPTITGNARCTVGFQAARRAIRLSGRLPPLRSPLVVELDVPANIAVGPVPWGLGPWLSGDGGAVVRVTGDRTDLSPLLERASGRSLIVVVRDIHRHSGQQALVSALTASRPDAVVVEMGLPVWRPACAAYIATHGATLATGQATAELLGLASR